ncbi:MAG: polyribonucleotide nucleotidyltransferase [Candidatus Liptonbacteria bacterium]|nr:polyribonucleotide nucleotidyltransferase [Candidatus Liptonbacteria bacterium]
MAIQRKQYTTEVGGKTLTIEISSLAEQANGAVLAKYGETVVLVTAVMGASEGNFDYVPLKVDYEERFYAAGKVIGSRYVRREGRPSEDAILSARLVDRVIRPLFDERIRREMQVVATVLAFDEENDPDFVGLAAASMAIGISDILWNGPASGVRVGKIGDQLVINPTSSQIRQSDCVFEIFAAGPKGKISMIELGGKEADEKDILEACAIAQKEIDKLVSFQEKIIKENGKKKTDLKLFEVDAELKTAAEKFLEGKLEGAIYKPNKLEYNEAMSKLRAEYIANLSENEKFDERSANFVWEDAVNSIVQKNILEQEKRPDGRKLNQVRNLNGEVGLFERTHGSGIFIRGNTQTLAVTTLAAPGAEQFIETMEITGKRRFMLHYNFPPYSVGETGTFRGPGRREIGHGALAEKALRPLIPPQEQFPYTIRVVAETLSSNGSSSMATVCASTLSLMDAGVPLEKPAAGIAMGIVVSGDGKYKILTDIQGPEDFYGGMDFKVAGTKDGVTAVQLDVKVEGLTYEMIEKTLAQAKEARLGILDFMAGILAAPREKLSVYAPTIIQLQINPDKIGAVIGSGGKVINGLIEKYGLGSIDIEEDGRVFISGTDIEKANAALEEIKALTREYKVGEIIEGSVIKILDFGAIVDLGGGRDGMIHVSELKNGFVKTVNEVVKVGDFVRAKIIRVDADGHIGLSLKQLQ